MNRPFDAGPAFQGKVAVVTGASSGIGRAIALELARGGASLLLSGRDVVRLDATARDAAALGAQCRCVPADLARPEELDRLAGELLAWPGGCHMLVHAAGVHRHQPLGDATPADWLGLYAVNTVAPHELTRRLAPALVARGGDVVFIGSSAGRAPRPEVAGYAAAKLALGAVADAWRAQLNARGVRVLHVVPGRTATPMQETLVREEGRAYHPERLLQPEDIARTVCAALALPRTAEVTDVLIRPFQAA